jgi:hypothetical protein
MSDDMQLVLAFDTDSEEFARGVEVGMIWGWLQHGADTMLEQTMQAENAEMVMRMAEAASATFTAEPLDDTWMRLTLCRGDADA